MEHRVDGYHVDAISYSHKQGDYVLRHKHANYEIVYYIAGKGLTTVYGEKVFNFKYSSDSIILIPPEVYHDEYANEPTEIICNQLNLSTEPKDALFFKKTAHTAAVFDKIKALMSEIGRLWFEMQEEGKDASKEIYGLLGRLELAVFKLTSSGKKGRSEYIVGVVETVKQYINNYYLNRIDYKILAEELGYSYERFRHIFVENTGMTLHVYQQGFRLDYAKRKLISSDEKIYRLANKCGFSNSIRFCEWFKNMVGMSPQQFREHNRTYRWGVITNYGADRETKIPLIVDVDFSSGMRAALLAVAFLFEKEKSVDLLCLTTASEGERELITAFAGAFGSTVPIGGAELLRECLLSRASRVNLLFTGRLTALAGLIRSEGEQWISDKAERIFLSGDCGEEGREVYETNLPLVYFDRTKPVTLGLSSLRPDGLLAETFQKFGISEYVGTDLPLASYAVLGGGGMFSFEHKGRCTVSDGGETEFIAGAGVHCLIKPSATEKLTEQLQQLLLKADALSD